MDGMTSVDNLIGLGEAARLLGLTRSSVYGLVRRGELHRQMTGVGRYGYQPDEVKELAAERARLYEPVPRGRPRPRRSPEELASA